MHRTNQGQSQLRRAVGSATRRRTLVLLVEHSAVSLAAVFGGAVLLLLLGSQILKWQWLLALVLVGLIVTALRVRKGLLGPYRVAQIIDRRMHLSDSLSTAWFLLADPQSSRNAFAEGQIAGAEIDAAKIEPAQVFPLVWRRTWALTGALAGVALGLFALRYLLTDTLSLKQAFIPIPALPGRLLDQAEQLAGWRPDPKHAAAETSRRGSKEGDGPKLDEDSKARKPPAEMAAEKPSNGAGKSARQPGSPLDGGRKQPGSPDLSSGSEQTPGGDKDGQKRDPSAGDAQAKKELTSDEAKNGETEQPPPGTLADKMKDALSSIMQKMRPQSGSPKSDAREQESKSGEQKAGNEPRDPQREQNSPRSQDNQGQSREQSAQAQSEAQASEKSPSTESHASNDSPNRRGSDAHSGIGRQDGDKALKEAEQLRAMGKLDEIVGKRSANLTGDMTVETRSSHQQLQTQYTGRVGRHADLGGEIDRSEVPLALQKYVRTYMEKVRKQANGQQ